MVVGALLALGAWSCSGDAANRIADAMVDGAAVLRDGAGGDAAAQVSYAADCQPVTYTLMATNGGATTAVETTAWFATASVPGLDPSTVTRAFAVVCGREVFTPAVTCPASAGGTTYACSGTWPYADELDCTTTVVQLGPGMVRAQCGSRSRGTGPTTNTDNGETRHHARFVIEM
jgi:hypothetical protein